MAQRESHYLHTALYAFDEIARDDVSRRFHAVMQHNTVQLHYYAPTETFIMRCPADQGATADASLRQIIQDYILTELDSADRENRRPHAVRFPESTFDELGAFCNNDQTDAAPAEHQSNQVPRTQIIITPENGGKLVKLFLFSHLQPYGLVDRAIAQANDRSLKAMSKGFVCRAARWSNSDGHVFNGRVDCHHAERTVMPGKGLQLPSFGKLRDRRQGIGPVEEPQNDHWRFALGQEDTTVKQWLQGTGDTRQEVPDAKAEIPKDAKQYLASAKTHTAGRARVVKGLSLMPADEIVEDASDSDDDCGNFISILRPPTASNALRIIEPDAKSEASERSAESQHASFRDLLFGGRDNALDRLGNTLSSTLLPTCSDRNFLPDEQTQAQQAPSAKPEGSAPWRSTLEHQSPTIASRHTFSEWRDTTNEGYTKVDTMGLTAHAKSTAEWQNLNRWALEGRRDKNRNSSRLVFREPLQSSFRPTDAHSRDLRPDGSQVSHSGSLAFSEPSAQQHWGDSYTGADTTWSNQQSTQIFPLCAQLVDLDTPQHSSTSTGMGSVKAPPGFHIKPDKDKQCSTTQSPEPPASHKLVNLVDLMDNEFAVGAASKTSKLPMSGSMPPLLPQTSTHIESCATAAAAQHGSDKKITVERVEPLRKGYAKKYNTMRQKAGYNVKGKKGKGQKAEHKFKVQLELPEPVPAPKAKQQKKAGSGAGKAVKQPGTQTESTSGLAAFTQSSRFKPSTRITQENHPFGKVLRSERLKLESYAEEENLESMNRAPKLVARLGLLLIRPDDKGEVSFSAQDPFELQSSLRECSLRTDFLPRLTSSTVDAATILDIASRLQPTAVLQAPHVVLELVIRETNSGNLVKVIIPGKEGGTDRANYSITTRERTLAEASCHYAMHVWDAQISLMQPESGVDLGLTSSINGLVASMNSDGEPPSFRAQVPKSAFTVERVLAKRSCEIDKSGIVFRLGEVQDLVLESLDLKDYNLRALSRSQEEMIADQRYWFEALWEANDLARADELQACVDEMVKRMDDVGLGNKGPFVVSEDYQSDDEPEVIEQPFW